MPDDFKTTRWSVVLAAAGQETDRHRALGWLCEAYWYPLYAFVRRRGHDTESASDVVQSYFLRVMEKDVFRDVDPGAGKFRAFLLASMKNFLSNEREREQAVKRRAENPAFTVSLDGADELYRREASQELNAEELFEKRWALTVLDRAVERLGRDYDQLGRGGLFERLRGFLTGEVEDSYVEIAAALDMKEGAVKTAIHRMRKRLGRVLREEVAQTVSDPEQLDDEIRHLLRVVG